MLLPSNIQLAIGAGLLVIGSVLGYKLSDYQHDTKELIKIKIEQSKQHKVESDTASAAKETASSVERVRVVHKTINKEVIKYVEKASVASCVLDADFVRIHRTSTNP